MPCAEQNAPRGQLGCRAPPPRPVRRPCAPDPGAVARLAKSRRHARWNPMATAHLHPCSMQAILGAVIDTLTRMPVLPPFRCPVFGRMDEPATTTLAAQFCASYTRSVAVDGCARPSRRHPQQGVACLRAVRRAARARAGGRPDCEVAHVSFGNLNPRGEAEAQGAGGGGPVGVWRQHTPAGRQPRFQPGGLADLPGWSRHAWRAGPPIPGDREPPAWSVAGR